MTDEELQEKNEKKAAAFEAMVNAAKIGNLNVLKAAVEDPELGISVNDQTIKGVTALHVASEAGQENIVEYLLEQAKADVNIRDNSRFTPMHRACSRGQYEQFTCCCRMVQIFRYALYGMRQRMT